MANRKTKPADLDTLFKLLEAARGENRSFREYARAAGVQHSLFNRIKRREFVPGLLTLQKLTSKEANPQNGVTLSSLWQAAGAPEIDFEGITRSLSLAARTAQQATAQVNYRNTVLESISKVLNEMDIGFTVDDIEKDQIIGLDLGGRLLIHPRRCPSAVPEEGGSFRTSPPTGYIRRSPCRRSPSARHISADW